jgi:protein gp37
MNRTKDTIGWCDYSWNPVVGCLHGCWYCYARNMAVRFPKNFPDGFMPVFHPERLLQPSHLYKPSKIFVCSIADLFAPWTPTEWRDRVLTAIFACPVKHTFQLLTKMPQRIPNLDYPDNVWLGATVTGEEENLTDTCLMGMLKAKVKFLSFEPLLGPIEGCYIDFQWIIIGHLTGAKKAPFNPDWVWEIVEDAKQHHIPIFMKENLRPYLNGEKLIQEFPS